MFGKIALAVVVALVVGSASAALARPAHAPLVRTSHGPVVTDEGQGRYAPADRGP
jgi:hypothetical protein